METACQYARFIYSYNQIDNYIPKDVNLGDYVQTLAATAFLPRVDTELDRDAINDCYPAVKTKLIANGWYYMDDKCHVFNENLLPLFVAVHINNPESFKNQPKVIEQFRRFSKEKPIGCRDLQTQRLLESFGVNAYFSSCLTTTLERSRFTDTEKREGCVICNLDTKLLTSKNVKPFPLSHFIRTHTTQGGWLSDEFGEIIRSYGSKVTQTSQLCPFNTTHEQRFQKARELLKIYANAEVVFTSRIHCALPCLALGTPVVLVAPYDPKRYEGLSELLNHVFVLNNRIQKTQIRYDDHGKIVNPDTFKPYADALKKDCQAFIAS